MALALTVRPARARAQMLVGFRYIDYVYGRSKTLRTAVLKMATGQATLMPPYLVLFFYYMGWLEGLTHAQRAEKIRSGFLPAAVTHMCFWCVPPRPRRAAPRPPAARPPLTCSRPDARRPFANMVNFTLISPQHRVAYVACLGVVWSSMLSYAESFTAQGDGRGVGGPVAKDGTR